MGRQRKLKNELKTLRQLAQITQNQLAELVGVSRKTINTVENGVFIPSTLLALQIAEVLKVPVEQIFSLEDE